MLRHLLDDRPSVLLRIYLNDHRAMAAGGIRVARRCERNNRGTPLGAYLEGFIAEIVEDRQAVDGLVRAGGLTPNPAKTAAVAVGETLGRAKLNGRLRGYSDLSRLEELEVLVAGVVARTGMWRALEAVDVAPGMHRDEVRHRIERGERQQRELERHRLAAVARALGDASVPSGESSG